MDIRIIKSKRKTLSIEVTSEKKVIVRAPMRMSNKDILAFVQQKQSWIDKTLSKVKEKNVKKLSKKELEALKKSAREYIPKRVAYFAEIIGVEYGKVSIKSQKTCWGSCSAKRNLNFNCLIMLCPEDVRDYVIIHELCHLIELNHSPSFWKTVERFDSMYKEHRDYLKINGKALISMIK